MDHSCIFGSDYAAAKVAGHELRGLIGYLNLELTELGLPLMALVDFLGFRLIAMSVCYGKTDDVADHAQY